MVSFFLGNNTVNSIPTAIPINAIIEQSPTPIPAHPPIPTMLYKKTIKHIAESDKETMRKDKKTEKPTLWLLCFSLVIKLYYTFHIQQLLRNLFLLRTEKTLHRIKHIGFLF